MKHALSLLGVLKIRHAPRMFRAIRAPSRALCSHRVSLSSLVLAQVYGPAAV
jgi:hypothetical protein